MPIAESDIIRWPEAGSGNMGAVGTPTSVARASLALPVYALKSLRVTFPTGTGSATLSIKRDSGYGTILDADVYTFGNVGGGGDPINFRVEESDLSTFTFRTDPTTGLRDIIVLDWTDPGTSTWLIEWGLVDGSLIGDTR